MIINTLLTWVFIIGGIVILATLFHLLKYSISSSYREDFKKNKIKKKLILDKLNQLKANYSDDVISNELYKGLEFVIKIDLVEDFINNTKSEIYSEFPELQNIYTLISSSLIYGVDYELNIFLQNIHEKAQRNECKNEIVTSIKLLNSMIEIKEKFKHHKNFNQICKLSLSRSRYNNILSKLRDFEKSELEKLDQEEIKTIEELKIEILNQSLNVFVKENFKNYKINNAEKIIPILFLIKYLENLSIELNSSLIKLKKD
jgi:hypothetical protein